MIDEFIGHVRELCKGQASARDGGAVTEKEEVKFQSTVKQLLQEVKKKATENPYLEHLLKQAITDFSTNDITGEPMDTNEISENTEIHDGGETDNENWYND